MLIINQNFTTLNEDVFFNIIIHIYLIYYTSCDSVTQHNCSFNALSNKYDTICKAMPQNLNANNFSKSSPCRQKVT